MEVNEKLEEAATDANNNEMQNQEHDQAEASAAAGDDEALELEQASELETEQDQASDLSEESVDMDEYPAEMELSDQSTQAAFELEAQFYDPQKQEDHLWQARTGLNKNTLCGAIETVIFMSDRPVPLIKIRSLIDEDMPLRVLHESISRLQEEYEQAHHGLRLVEVAEGYQFRTKATYSRFVQDLFKVNSLVLSPTALEVLAIIAYRQPVAKTEVDKIRGVDSGHIVRGLMDKRLVKTVGRSDEMGRPVLYATTQEFLEVFNLADISQLPSEHELASMTEASIGSISDIKTLVHQGDKARFVFDEIDELDQLSESIKAVSADTEFTKSLKDVEKSRLEGNVGTDGVKSAFDLLEEYVTSKMIIQQNEKAADSDLLTAGIDPTVVEDLSKGPFNEPLSDEDFQMIDLETGEAILEEDEASEDDSDFVAADEPFLFEGEEGSDEDADTERASLTEALDSALEKLKAKPFDQGELADEDWDQDHDIEDKGEALDELQRQIAESAKDYDLDLQFMQDEEESHLRSERPENPDDEFEYKPE